MQTSVPMLTTRPPEPLKDRLATIVQRGHVDKLTSDEVAEHILRELGAVTLTAEQIQNLPTCGPVASAPFCTKLGLSDVTERIAELEKDAARLDWLETQRPEVNAFAEIWEVAGWNTAPTLRAAIDAAISAATKEGK